MLNSSVGVCVIELFLAIRLSYAVYGPIGHMTGPNAPYPLS